MMRHCDPFSLIYALERTGIVIVIKEITSKSVQTRLIKQGGLDHFFFRWREEAVQSYLRRLRARVMTSSPV